MTFLTYIDSFMYIISQFLNRGLDVQRFVDLFQRQWCICSDNEFKLFQIAKVEVSNYYCKNGMTFDLSCEECRNDISRLVRRYEGFTIEDAYPVLEEINEQLSEIFSATNCYYERNELADNDYNPPLIINDVMLLEEVKNKYLFIVSKMDILNMYYNGDFIAEVRKHRLRLNENCGFTFDKMVDTCSHSSPVSEERTDIDDGNILRDL